MITLKLFGHEFAQCFSLEGNFRISNEMREDACLAYVREGHQEVFSATQKIEATNNEGILMKCGNFISNINKTHSDKDFMSVVFHLDPESIHRAFNGKDLSFLKVDKDPRPIDPALKIDRSELLDSFVESMMPYFHKPELASEELLATKMQELVYILSDSGKNRIATQILGTLFSPEDISFQEIISANLYNNLTIPDLAHLTARSESTFKRDFRKIFNSSPAKYIKTKRLERAAKLLRSTNQPVSEVAWDCGFENAAHFSASFSKFYGVSPVGYRV